MLKHRFAILEHTMPDGQVHHDLLIDHPAAPASPPPENGAAENGVGYHFPKNEKMVSDTVFSADAKTLWAVRIDPPPHDWPQRRQLVLTALPPHRRRYLDYEGPISRGRGSVRRVARGLCEVVDEPRRKIVRLTIADHPLTLTITTDIQGQLVAEIERPA